MKTANVKHARRSQRARTHLKKVANGRPRLSVHRSSKNISAQIIDDEKGVTLAAASSLEEDFIKKHKKGSN
ncbi:MAG: 50S ribosomal protein L18, partial [Hyphomonadaceae bacterium]